MGKHLNNLNIKIYGFSILLKVISSVRLFSVIENDYLKTEPKFSVIKNPKTEPSVFVSVRFFRSGFFGYFGYSLVISVFCSPLLSTLKKDRYSRENAQAIPEDGDRGWPTVFPVKMVMKMVVHDNKQSGSPVFHFSCPLFAWRTTP
ncbi:hypothetical protein HanPI659440_Chr06g0228981 [Helianthus annuus]|nr:hypothetical protein HanPI659440_Chr06g0228981 [Helianthus annuus]